ncbi:MAG: T9SS type A sorting domain-containing protein [Bacteroidetes bacterium]|nr:T9SS type A sorting domain-containing protein [Bacteroidota bacterium]
MKFCFFSCFALLIQPLFAQQPVVSWAKQNGSGDFERAAVVTADAQGNVYSCGKFESTVDFNPAPGSGNNIYNLASQGGTDGYVQKLDAAGNFVWALQIGGSGGDEVNGMCIDAAGNIIVTGFFTGVIDMDPGAATVMLGSSPTWVSDVFVASFSPQGQLNWAKALSGPALESAMSVCPGSNGQSVIAGSFENTVDFDPGPAVNALTAAGSSDAFVVVLNSMGNFVWAKTFGGSGFDQVNAVRSDAQGQIVAAGQFEDSVDFDPGAGTYYQTSAGRIDGFVLQLASNGAFNWAAALGGPEKDYVNDVAADAWGNVYLTGKIIGSADVDPGSGVYTLNDSLLSGGCMVVKLNESGSFAWGYLLANSAPVDGMAIEMGLDGALYLALNFFDTLDADPSAAVANYIQNGSSVAADFLVLRNDTAGQFNWAFSIGGIYDDFAEDIYINQLGVVYVTGQFTGSTDFDYSQNNLVLTSAWQNSDVFVARYDQSGVGIPPGNTLLSGIKVYPNPFYSTLMLDLSGFSGNVLLEFTDMCGRTVNTAQLTALPQTQYTLDLPAGVYMLRVSDAQGKTAVERVLKQ